MKNQMKPDITTIIPSKTGMEVLLQNLVLSGLLSGDGWEWDMMGYLATKDDGSDVVVASLAVKGFKAIIETKLQRGNVVSVRGKFGKFEKSTTGSEMFRRIFCDVKDITVLERIDL